VLKFELLKQQMLHVISVLICRPETVKRTRFGFCLVVLSMLTLGLPNCPRPVA
jgi:hypothetical protein